jgi:hypothetical protein
MSSQIIFNSLSGILLLLWQRTQPPARAYFLKNEAPFLAI